MHILVNVAAQKLNPEFMGTWSQLKARLSRTRGEDNIEKIRKQSSLLEEENKLRDDLSGRVGRWLEERRQSYRLRYQEHSSTDTLKDFRFLIASGKVKVGPSSRLK